MRNLAETKTNTTTTQGTLRAGAEQTEERQIPLCESVGKLLGLLVCLFVVCAAPRAPKPTRNSLTLLGQTDAVRSIRR